MPTRSLIQTCVCFSLLRIALRSALLYAFSNAEIGSLALTPLFLSTYSLPRASNATCSINRFTRSLTFTFDFCSSSILRFLFCNFQVMFQCSLDNALISGFESCLLKVLQCFRGLYSLQDLQ